MPRIWTVDTTALTDEHIAALDSLLADWQDDDTEPYGWTGAAEGVAFVRFWLEGTGRVEVLAIVEQDEDAYRVACRYLDEAA